MDKWGHTRIYLDKRSRNAQVAIIGASQQMKNLWRDMWTLGLVELRGVGPAPVLEAIARRAHVAERAAQEGREKRTKNGCNMRVAACPHGNHASSGLPLPGTDTRNARDIQSHAAPAIYLYEALVAPQQVLEARFLIAIDLKGQDRDIASSRNKGRSKAAGSSKPYDKPSGSRRGPATRQDKCPLPIDPAHTSQEIAAHFRRGARSQRSRFA
ncbi:hypothetical protein FA13DRAFT_985452 [Coprinellus micaceus]|uniref:Uncharacterized protein n=1 Tax=Coprinellus micaceus TaxID=71717 RepID=A0A4Y7RS99_COPMI|nr:hypothetical protein FA13DRAFT_985452 [Coprinellus micaceus]